MTPHNPATGSLKRLISQVAIMAAALSFFGSPAHANRYLFSFTTTQVMAALQTSVGTTAFDESAYFAIFTQPDPSQVTSFTVTGTISPNVDDPNVWLSQTISDPSSPNLGYSSLSPCVSNCTWADFSKTQSQTTVTVISGANGGPGGANIFIGNTWSSYTTAPYGWGITNGVIQTVMPGADTFDFVIDTNLTLSGSYRILGYASDIKSTSQTSMSVDTKEDHGISFNLTATPSVYVPEPGSMTLIGAGALALIATRYRAGRKAKGSRFRQR